MSHRAHCSPQAGTSHGALEDRLRVSVGVRGTQKNRGRPVMRYSVACTVLSLGPILTSDPFAQDEAICRRHLHQQLQESSGPAICPQTAPGHHEQAAGVSRHSSSSFLVSSHENWEGLMQEVGAKLRFFPDTVYIGGPQASYCRDPLIQLLMFNTDPQPYKGFVATS